MRTETTLTKAEFDTAVAELMGRIAADGDDDVDALWELHELAGPSVERIIRAEARRLSVRIDRDDICGLVLDGVVELGEVADTWKPSGAPPWVYAQHRLRSLVHRHIGVFADELDEVVAEAEAPEAVARLEDPLEALREMSASNPVARELLEQLESVATERDAQIYLWVRLEKAAGNRSPAVTVAVDFGLQPATVRKVYQRVGERLGLVA